MAHYDSCEPDCTVSPTHLARHLPGCGYRPDAPVAAGATVTREDGTSEGTDVPEQIARYVEATAVALSPSGYKAGIASAVRLIRRWRPEADS